MNIKSDKRGAILIFTLIILAVFLSTALTFSFFIISDINKARAVDDSVVAYYGADSGIEESLYLIKKMELTGSMKGLISLKPDIYNLVSSGAKWNIAESVDYERNILRQRIANGQSAKFFILNRNVTTTDSVSVEWYKGKDVAGNPSSAKIQVALTQLTPQDSDGTIIYYTDTSEIIIPDSTDTGQDCFELKNKSIDGSLLGDKSDYLMEAKVLGSGSNDFVDRLIVKAYSDTSCKTENNEGISSLTLKSKGTFGKSTQYVIAHIVPRNPVSGLLSFVLFSEQDIAKDSE
jgi:hypothetical protein